MTEERLVAQLPAEVIREDRDLEQSMESASEALAHLRWHWTIDESNPKRVSQRQYAREVGRSYHLIRQYAQGYVLYAQSEKTSPLTECFERARHSVEKQEIIEAVADTNKLAYHTVTNTYKEEVKQVRAAVENERERREEQGRDFAAEERAEYARKVAEQKSIAREREEREQRERARQQRAQFIEADARLSKARREAREALSVIRETEFTDEEAELLLREQATIQGILGLISSALQGDSGTDWDAELAELEERRQHG